MHDYEAIYTKVIAVYNIGLLDKSDLCGYHRKQQAVLSFSVCKIFKKMPFCAAEMFVFIKANRFGMILVAHFEFLVL